MHLLNQKRPGIRQKRRKVWIPVLIYCTFAHGNKETTEGNENVPFSFL
ncbi:hypothetical protein FLA_5429 [Filimonas lacunae]|nr:hypothetical protein FLA_5429 [Filimonas lacunae]